MHTKIRGRNQQPGLPVYDDSVEYEFHSSTRDTVRLTGASLARQRLGEQRSYGIVLPPDTKEHPESAPLGQSKSNSG
ncbi:MAG: hypothetical protein ACRCSF_05945 [Mycobacteriaceae bacterium]